MSTRSFWQKKRERKWCNIIPQNGHLTTENAKIRKVIGLQANLLTRFIWRKQNVERNDLKIEFAGVEPICQHDSFEKKEKENDGA